MNRRVLVVEDNPDLRRLLAIVLERGGFECIEAVNETDALGRDVDSISAIIADVNLSETGGASNGGIVLAERLADQARQVPIILISQTPWHHFPDHKSGAHTEWLREKNVSAVLDRSEPDFYRSLCEALSDPRPGDIAEGRGA